MACIKKAFTLLSISFCLSFTANIRCLGQPGTLDLGFGSGGIVTTSIGAINDYGSSVAIQNDGKIIVGGYSMAGAFEAFSLVRYNNDGSLDLTFDSDGKVATNIGNYSDRANSVVIQSDGKIIAAGWAETVTGRDFALVRYNEDGSLDTSFSSDGKQTTSIGSNSGGAYALTLQIDGKILVAGDNYSGPTDDFAVLRYNANGALDNSFDLDGIVTTDFASSNDYVSSITVQNDGKILLAGYTNNGTGYDFALVRYNSDGSMDNNFSSDAKVTTDFSGFNDYGKSITIQIDGKILVAGHSNNGSDDDFAIARYNIDGSLDNSFEIDGKTTTNISGSNDIGNSIVLQNDGKIVVAGYAGSWIDANFTLLRYNYDGTLDNSFGLGGVVTTDIDTNGNWAYGCALQSDGKIVVAGTVFDGTSHKFGVVRYDGGALGIEVNNFEQLLKVYPNPSAGQINILSEIIINSASINLFSQSGQIMPTNENRFDNLITMDISDFTNGIYFLEIIEGKKMARIKIIKN